MRFASILREFPVNSRYSWRMGLRGDSFSDEGLKLLYSKRFRLVKDENYHCDTGRGKVGSNCFTAALVSML